MRTFGLIGKNIDYSFSRKYFSEKFKIGQIDAEYKNFDIPGIEDFSGIIEQNRISGLNVTIPYKEKIIGYLDHLDSHAQQIQAVNTIKFEKDGSLCGYNTDYWGFLESIKRHLRAHHTKALILGTGGASKAIAYALELLEISYTFVSRKPGKGQLTYSQLDKHSLETYHLIINTTPLGTYPDIENHPAIPFTHISEKHLVYDLIYNPPQTKLLQLAAQNGATIVNGELMLKLQAEKAWDIWNSQ